MRTSANSGSYFRRGRDLPVLVVSQDYELFFRDSGSIEKCLFEPAELLANFAKQTGVRVSFFVDAGMLCRMQQLAPKNAVLERDLSRIRQHIASLFARGHEIGLHIHPHWEDTRWNGGQWDFSSTRYQLRDFTPDEIANIVARYTAVLNDLCDSTVGVYRAGGFCVTPFEQLRQPLLDNGISVDSSVVPGMRLRDPEKGFSFARAPRTSWWQFDESPLVPTRDGQFLEIAITPVKLPFHHYWGRAIDRVIGRQPAGVIGDGTSKAIGKREILRRLAGAGRVSELSIDVAKAGQLLSRRVLRKKLNIWQIMGHPKLLGRSSLEVLRQFIAAKDIHSFETLSGLAAAIRAGDLPEGVDYV